MAFIQGFYQGSPWQPQLRKNHTHKAVGKRHYEKERYCLIVTTPPLRDGKNYGTLGGAPMENPYCRYRKKRNRL